MPVFRQLKLRAAKGRAEKAAKLQAGLVPMVDDAESFGSGGGGGSGGSPWDGL